MKVQVFLNGGLGNQLFQYAAGLYFSKLQGKPLIIRTDLLPYRPDNVGITSRWPEQISEFRAEGQIQAKSSQPIGRTHLFSKILQVQRLAGDISPSLFLRFGIVAGNNGVAASASKAPMLRTINSHFISPIPATLLGDYIRDQIRSINSPSRSFLTLVEQARDESPHMVHVRLGDFIQVHTRKGIVDSSTLLSSLGAVNRDDRRPTWVFTDSKKDLYSLTGGALRVDKVISPSDLRRPIENLVLMSSGHSLFCVDSTFSWWAAFLKGPSENIFFPKQKSQSDEPTESSLILPHWNKY